jgi:signal transduction histidine kinase
MEQLLGEQQTTTVSIAAAQINEQLRVRQQALALIAAGLGPDLLANPAALQALIEQRLALQGLFNAGIFVTRPDGTAIAEFPRAGRIGLNYIDSDHVAAALQEGKATIGKLVLGKRPTSASFAITVPIRDARGEVIGALSGATDMAKPSFLDLLETSRYGHSGGYLLVDSGHKLFVLASENNEHLRMQPLPEPGKNTILDRRMEGFDGPAITLTSTGMEVLTSASRIPAAGWFVIATLPTSEAFAPARQMQLHMLLAAAILTVLAGALTWWILNHELAPVVTAIKTLAEFAETEKSAPSLPVTRHDEVGVLIRAFNHLIAKLEGRNLVIQDLGTHMEARIVTRTRELAAANKELEELVYTVAHDLRSPLHGIAGYAHILNDDYAAQLDQAGGDMLLNIKNLALKMGNLITDTLKLSNFSNAKINTRQIDIAALGRQAAAEHMAAEPERNVRFDSPASLPARGDPTLLTAVLENLIDNAWKFTGKHASAHVELGVIEENGERIYFVRDNGAGFDSASASKLFTPFHRLHRDSDFPGNGIGLATVQRIIARHGGRTWAEGAVEKGATFYFTLAD